jgi:hypothetical protein
MPDDVLDLSGLAPDVDLSAARALFDRGRSRRRRRRQIVQALGGVALVGGLIGLALAIWPEDTNEVRTAPSEQPAEEPATFAFEVLQMAAVGDEMGRLRAAVDPAQLEALWAEAGLPGRPEPTDFDRWVIVTITIPDDACPPTLTDFQISGDEPPVITPTFEETAQACVYPLIPKTFVVAIDRAWASPRFTLRLPADEVYGFGEHRLDIMVPERTGPTTVETTTTVAPPEPAAVMALVDFAADRSPELATSVGFAPPVALGLGSDLLATLDGAQLADPAAWLLDLDGRWARTGSVSALDLLARPLDSISMERSRTLSCAGPSPVAVPPQLEGLERVSITPVESYSCLDWFAVDVYLDDARRIVAVTVELYEP